MLEHHAVVILFGFVDIAFSDEGCEERLAGLDRYCVFFEGEVVAVYAEKFEA